MAVVNGLQRQMKAAARAAAESASDIKEISVVEHATQPEGVYKKSDASGYYHFMTQEWLNSVLAGLGGGRQVGIEDDSFSVLSGDTHIQATVKEIDTALATKSVLSDSGSFTLTSADMSGTMNLIWKNINGIIHIFSEASQEWSIMGVGGSKTMTATPSAGFDDAKPTVEALIAFPIFSQSTDHYMLYAKIQTDGTWLVQRENGANWEIGGIIIDLKPSLIGMYPK